MQRIPLSSLRPGDQFEQALFLPSGQKLLRPRVRLNESHLRLLARQAVVELQLADSLGELASAGLMRRVDVSQLRTGDPAETDIYTPGGVLLVERGQAIEAHHLASLGAAGAGYVHAGSGEGDPACPRRDRMLLADLATEQLEQEAQAFDPRLPPQEMEIWDCHEADRDATLSDEGMRQMRAGAVSDLSGIYSRIGAGLQVSIGELESIVNGLLGALLSNRRNFAQIALAGPRRQDDLPDHAYTVAALAMAAAAQMTWALADVRLIGLAGLTFDLGMLLVPQRVRIGGSQLTDRDRNLIQRHPSLSLVMMQSITDLPLACRVGAFQHHERENGGGYPRGLRGQRISDIARMLAIADVFAAMTSPRGYRQVRLPYAAMEQLIRCAADGQFHKPGARALVQAVGLFPVGSYVRLSDHRIARVVAVSPNHLDRPVVQVLDEQGGHHERPIDLQRIPVETLAVARPVPEPDTLRRAG